MNTNYKTRDQIDRVDGALLFLWLQKIPVTIENVLKYTLHFKSEDISESRWAAMVMSESKIVH